jgi:tetratricopeptide (TPR) repeat protein
MYKQEILQITKEIKTSPNLPELYYQRSYLYYFSGQNKKALKDLNRAIEVSPDAPQYLDSRIDLALRLEQYELVIKDTTHWIQTTGSNSNAFISLIYNMRGIAYRNSGNNEAALADFNHSIHLNPNPRADLKSMPNADAYFNRGVLYKDLGNYPQAKADLSAALQGYCNEEELTVECEAAQKELDGLN